MKNLRNTFTLLLLTLVLNSFAQDRNPKLDSALHKGLQMIKTSESPEAWLNSANYFERISKVESKDWLPMYYAAYSNLLAGIESKDMKLKDQLLDKGLEEIEQSNSLSPDNSEIYVLKGYLEYMKLSIDPQSRLAYMAASATSLEHAKRINPDNPRIYLIKGQNKFYTPEAFGGGKATAKPILETAAAKFTIFKATSPLMPSWGLERAKFLLSQCN